MIYNFVGFGFPLVVKNLGFGGHQASTLGFWKSKRRWRKFETFILLKTEQSIWLCSNKKEIKKDFRVLKYCLIIEFFSTKPMHNSLLASLSNSAESSWFFIHKNCLWERWFLHFLSYRIQIYKGFEPSIREDELNLSRINSFS